MTCGVAILAAGCAARNSTITGSGGTSAGNQTGGTASARPPTTSSGRVLHGGSSASRGTATSAAPHKIPAAAAVDDNAALGHNTHLYLNGKVPKLLVEILAVQGYGPAQQAIDTLRARLRSVADKPGGIVVLPIGTIAGGGRATWTVPELVGAEAQSSHHRSSAAAIVLHILYVNGQYDDGSSGGSNALGAAFNASTFAIFKERIANASTPLVPPDAIEAADVVHETGHVLALVSLTYHSPRNHEDPNHPGHSSNQNSVMYYAIDNVGVVDLLGGRIRPPTDFDANDRADLQDLKTGKLP